MSPSSRLAEPVTSWCIRDLTAWLEQKMFSKSVCLKFARQKVDGQVFLSLTENYLKNELGISGLADRLKLLKCREELLPARDRRLSSASIVKPAQDSRKNYHIVKAPELGLELHYASTPTIPQEATPRSLEARLEAIEKATRKLIRAVERRRAAQNRFVTAHKRKLDRENAVNMRDATQNRLGHARKRNLDILRNAREQKQRKRQRDSQTLSHASGYGHRYYTRSKVKDFQV